MGIVMNDTERKFTRTRRSKYLLRSSLALSALMAAAPAFAQDGSETTDDVVYVTGIRASIGESLDEKRNSVNVVDYITAEDIGKFPDNNLSEALQRIPGITIGRSETGEGKEINLRGLGPNFSRTEINGGSGINDFDFTVLPSELFAQIAVEKSPTAQTVEGALAGVVRAETPKPFNYSGTRGALSGTASIGESGHVGPRVFGMISHNVDDRFGISLSGFYSDRQFNSSQISFGSWVPFRNSTTATGLATLPTNLLDAATPRTPGYYKYTENRENYAGVGTLQFRASDQLEATFDIIYASAKGRRADDRPDVWTSSITPTSYTIADEVVTQATYSDPGLSTRIGTTFQDIDQNVLQGNFRVKWSPSDNWTISPGISYVKAEKSLNFDLYSFAIPGGTFDYIVDGAIPNFSSSVTDFSTNPEDFMYNIFLFGKQREEINEKVFTLDSTRSFDNGPISAFNIGMRYGDRDRESKDGAKTWLPGSSATVQNMVDQSLAPVVVFRDFDVGGAPSHVPSQILGVDYDAVRALYHPNTDGFDEGTDWGIYDRGETSNYIVSEKTFAAYASVDLEYEDFRLNAGLRVVHTKSIADGNQVVGSVVTPRHVVNKYWDYLPSLNATYEIIENGLIRASYSKTINRPNLSDLRPAQVINNGAFTGSRGNPLLQPFEADMIDLGFEYYFADGALFQVTGFVKEIGTLITQENVNELATFPDQLTGQPTTGIISFTQPVNGDEATVKGLETGFTTPFYFLDGFGQDLGVILNYTYAESEATRRAPDGSFRSTPLPGLSKHSLNAALYYDNGGVNSRLAYTWRSSYLRDDNVGRQYGAERYIDGYGQLDYSLTIPVMDWAQVSFEALNLLDNKTEEYSLLANGQKPPTNFTDKERIFLVTVRGSF